MQWHSRSPDGSDPLARPTFTLCHANALGCAALQRSASSQTMGHIPFPKQIFEITLPMTVALLSDRLSGLFTVLCVYVMAVNDNVSIICVSRLRLSREMPIRSVDWFSIFNSEEIKPCGCWCFDRMSSHVNTWMRSIWRHETHPTATHLIVSAIEWNYWTEFNRWSCCRFHF